MPKVHKLSVNVLKRLIQQESKSLREAAIEDVSKIAKKTKEVDADEHGTKKVLEKDLDQLKAQKVKEAKLVRMLKTLRESMKVRRKRINEARSLKKSQ